jgi:AraC-like DNA-binding protein
MNFKVIQPPHQLADYVRFFWFSEGNASIHKPFVHHAFAYPCPELLFCYKGQFKYNSEFEAERTLSSGIYGQTQTFSKVASKADFGIFGFYLYPHALPQLFCLPANELTNQSADIKTFCGKEGEILEEKIMLALDNDQRVKLASDFLEARLKNVKTEYTNIFSSIKTISNSCRVTSVKALADNSFLSVRQFERRFKEFSGFSPKLFLRITRFNSVLNKTFQNKSITQIAYEYGYYDQSHFIHDFQKFSGCNPKEYFKQETIVANDRGTIEFKK